MRILVRALSLAIAMAIGASPVSERAAANTPEVRQSDEALANRFLMRGGLGVDVRIDFDLHAPRYVGPAGTGPYLIDGTIGILAGPRRVRSVFSLASLGALPPAYDQTIEPDYHTGCGSAGPIAIEPLAAAEYPAVIVYTVVGKGGCAPVAHVFVPSGRAAAPYVNARSYELANSPPSGATASRRIVVSRVRSIVVRKPPGVSYVIDWPIAVIDGRDRTGRAVTIALDRPDQGLIPPIGESLTLYDVRSRAAGALPIAVRAWSSR